MIDVVAMCFIKNNSFIIALPRSSKNTNLYTLIGGKVKENEKFDDAIIREVKEELFIDLKKEEFKLILEFQEHAGSDPNLMINMHMFLTEYEIDVLPEVNDEILDYKWFNIGDDESILCDSIKLHLLPYLKNKTTINM